MFCFELYFEKCYFVEKIIKREMQDKMTGIKEIYIAAENWSEGQWNYNDDNTDVIVTTDEGEKYVATFFTYKNIERLRKKNKETGECFNGKYFWASDMILIDDCSRENIEKVIAYLIEENEFLEIFNEIG